MSLVGLLLLMPLLAAQAPAAGPVPPKIVVFLEKCEDTRRGAILQIEHQLRGLRRETPASKQTIRQINLLEEQLRTLHTNKTLLVPPLSFPPQTGSIGRLDGLACHVDQVVDRQELLVNCFFRVPITTVRNFQRYRETVTQSVPFLIRGLDTRSFKEGQDAEIPGVFEVSSTERYRTQSGGYRQVIVLTPFDLQVVDQYRNATPD